MPGLLLRKTSQNSKSKEKFKILKRRLSPCKNGLLDQLMFEGKTIQDRLQNNDKVTKIKNKEVLTFAQKVNKAIKILEKTNEGGIIPLSDETFEILSKNIPRLQKHQATCY